MQIQRCSGRMCMVAEECLHYLESKKPPRKGKWIRPQICTSKEHMINEKIVPKEEYDQFLSKEKL